MAGRRPPFDRRWRAPLWHDARHTSRFHHAPVAETMPQDGREHTFGAGCWCEPQRTVFDDGSILFEHRSEH